ncbi:ROK family transcriptional regulator [bacterium]|nr:ROK family transcriptional regulator [bacterium]
MTQTLNSTLMRSVNRSAILDLIRHHGPITRAEIGRQLDVSLPTVMRIIDDLTEAQLVKYIGVAESSGGRPASLLEFNGQAHSVIGIDLGGSKIYGAVADLSGNIQYEIKMPVKRKEDVLDVEVVLDLIQKLLDAPHPAGQKVRGIGVGMPGVTQAREGVVLWAPSLGWRDFRIGDILKERFGIEAFVENDVNLMALGELNFGAGKGVENLVVVTVGTGVGAGIIINRVLYHGHDQASGEIGYLLMKLEDLDKKYEGFGAFESQASGLGIERRARKLLKKLNLPDPGDDFSAEEVFAAARDEVPWAKEVIQETIRLLSMAIANFSTLLNPEMVILGGGVARSADMLIEPIKQTIEGVIPYVPKIEASELGSRAAVMGAIALVLSGTTDDFVVERVL